MPVFFFFFFFFLFVCLFVCFFFFFFFFFLFVLFFLTGIDTVSWEPIDKIPAFWKGPPLLKVVYSKKKKTIPSGSKFFPLKVDPFSKGSWCTGKQTGSHKNVSIDKHGGKSTRAAFRSASYSRLLCLGPLLLWHLFLGTEIWGKTFAITLHFWAQPRFMQAPYLLQVQFQNGVLKGLCNEQLNNVQTTKQNYTYFP